LVEEVTLDGHVELVESVFQYIVRVPGANASALGTEGSLFRAPPLYLSVCFYPPSRLLARSRARARARCSPKACALTGSRLASESCRALSLLAQQALGI
jgi:hypothetical protein